MQLHIYKDADEVCNALAAWITSFIESTLQVKERFCWALSGGETPKKLYKILAAPPYSEKIKWERVHIFWGDERMVPFADERNNAKMAFDNLLSKVNIPAINIHRIWTDVEPGAAAKQYEKLLHQYFDDKQTTFDLVLLGMGDDGHTLSLFPDSDALIDQQSWVKGDDTEQKSMKRVTLMPAVVNRSAEVVFFVTGECKAKILKEVINADVKKYPAQLIQSANGELHWFVDEAAAKYLEK